MEQDRWTKYLKTHKDAKVFKSKPLPFPEEMAALFDGTSARGDDKWAPTMDGVPEDITTDVDSKDSAASENASDAMMGNIRRKRPRPPKKQLVASNDAINACIIDLAASVKASTQVATPSVQSEGPTIDDCIDVLHAMPEISEASPLYLIALTCFMVKDKRTIWMRFRTDEGKIAWLKHQLQLEKGNASGSDSGL
ncbi:hypothetical protein CKAN_00862000 [Cinnamomum micranthum f. kanehirae]|uniref:Uncharacterized protein n=1 Tax=Cinnamomum micranthum f. kanehirae TaxID=337451 RepID=A0A443NN86_9MAGN|nr:hypothetical protein CKAN_00862000 [Cinnamomum micranthum f. kanehirae]